MDCWKSDFQVMKHQSMNCRGAGNRSYGKYRPGARETMQKVIAFKSTRTCILYVSRKQWGILHNSVSIPQCVPLNLALLIPTGKWTSHSRQWFYLSFPLPGFSHLLPLTLRNLVHDTAIKWDSDMEAVCRLTLWSVLPGRKTTMKTMI